MSHASYSIPSYIPTDIFRAYDIRGVIDQSLTPDLAYALGLAIGSAAQDQQQQQVIVARDGRLSGPSLSAGLVAGLCASGCDVIDIGMVPTPLLYFAAATLKTQSGVMLTGSHNPPDYNGFKMVIAGTTLSETAIQDLYQRIIQKNFRSGSGTVKTYDITPDYLRRIIDDVILIRPLKVVVDCGNGVAGVVAPKLLRRLGCEVIELYCDIDGNFPNHHPDPSQPKNLAKLIESVQTEQADVGLAFDGDGDRLGVVDNQGNIIWPDRQLMLYAIDVLSRNPGAEIIYDVKCSRHLTNLVKQHHGIPCMWKTGHSLIKAKLKETNAPLAGEMSGHIFFKERWYGFDDGIYTAARLLEILAATEKDTATVFAKIPNSISTPELQIAIADTDKFNFVKNLADNSQFIDATITTIDGIRADFADGWGLVRASNTTPCLVLRFEADNVQALNRIQEQFRQQLLALNHQLILPF